MYLAWYGFGRMLIEGLRTDSLYIGVFRISQVVGFLCFAICTALLVYFYIRSRRGELDTEEYVPVYEKLRGIGFRRRAKAGVEGEEENAKNNGEVLSEIETKNITVTEEKEE
jgi:hypothetical protein